MNRLLRHCLLTLLVSTSALVTAGSALAGDEAQPPQPTDDVQGQIDELLASYQATVDAELQDGKTEVVMDPINGEMRLFVGESAEKIDSLWQETLEKINALLARPASDREDTLRAVRAVDGSDLVYIQSTRSPYNRVSTLEVYRSASYMYSVDIATNQIVERLLLDDWDYRLEPIYSVTELETIARSVIRQTGPADLDLSMLSLRVGNKLDETFFFRWENVSAQLDGETHPFVQVGLSRAGDFLNYVNTLPLAHLSGSVELPFGFAAMATTITPLLRPLASPPNDNLATYFNEVYANGGSYWQLVTGTVSTQSNAGYCYIAGWCSPKNFYYKTTCYGCTTAKGRWNPNANPTVTSYAFIPSTHATTLQACYWNFYNGGSSTHEHCVNQSIYYNTWVAASYTSLYNIKKIELSNLQDAATLKEIAWDEVWLYSPS